MNDFFTPWQRRSVGNLLTALLWVAAGTVVLWLLVKLAAAVAFLQPVLIPFAVATVLAFFLEPVVRLLCARTRLSRTAAVSVLLGGILLAVAAVGTWALPRLYRSSARMVHDLPAFARQAQGRLTALVGSTGRSLERMQQVLPPAPTPAPLAAAPAPGAAPVPVNPAEAGEPAPLAGDLNGDGKLDTGDVQDWLQEQLPKLGEQAPALLKRVGELFFRAVGGFLGAFGVLLNAIIIPIYLFFLLTESRAIAQKWTDYLPMRDGHAKQETVSVLQEIHGYLVAFFRGQLLVSTIDAVLIGGSLWLFLGLNFSLFIGVLVLFLTFIPYLGILICYVPALFIAVVQFGDWQHPLYVVLIMFGVQTLESTVIAPKIVGESTGLHPLTVIVSVFAWSALLEGPIGALLAVPLTASLKVLMRRFVWERARERARVLPTAKVLPVLRAGDRDRFGDGDPDIEAVPAAVAHPKEAPAAPAGAASANPAGGGKTG